MKQTEPQGAKTPRALKRKIRGLVSTSWRLGVLALFVTIAPTSLAQNAGTQLIRPWLDDKPFEFSTSITFQGEGSASGPAGSGDVQVFQYRGHGRWRLNTTDPNSPRAALSFDSVDLVTDDIGLADDFFDVSVAGGFGIDLVEDEWRLALAGGFGSASNDVFNDPDGVYGIGAVVLTWILDLESTLSFSITYDGNRAIWPDLPLPGITYQTRKIKDVVLTIGLPIANVRWTPIENLRIDLSYIIPDNVYFNIEYDLIEQVTLYSKFDQVTETYHLEGDSDRRRIIFSQRRIELGVKGRPLPHIEIIGGVGYAFSQTFERGWDLRNTSELFDISDEPYGRLGVTIRF